MSLIRRFLWPVAIIAAGAFVSGCGGGGGGNNDSPQEQVTAQTTAAERELTQEDLNGLMAFFSETYIDGDGFDKSDMREYFEVIFSGGTITALNVLSRNFVVDSTQQGVTEVKQVSYAYRLDDGATTSGREQWDIIWIKEGDTWRIKSFMIHDMSTTAAQHVGPKGRLSVPQ